MIYYREILDMKEKNYRQHSEEAQKLLLEALYFEYNITELPEIAREKHGKPYFPEYPQICFNYSHCRKGVLCGISERPIGVDAETLRPFRESLAKRVCHPQEWALLQKAENQERLFMKLWVCKEALGKYTGRGVFAQPQQTDLSGILRGAEKMTDGPYLKIWEEGDLFLCACADNSRDLRLLSTPFR